jgi:DUF1680 family protein
VQVVEANPQVANDTGRVAIQRGPLVYCMEEIERPDGVSIVDLAVNRTEARSAILERVEERLAGGSGRAASHRGSLTIGQHRAMLCTPDTAVIGCRADGCG